MIKDINDCILSGIHLQDCDEDGYCNSCGYQEDADCPECGPFFSDQGCYCGRT